MKRVSFYLFLIVSLATSMAVATSPADQSFMQLANAYFNTYYFPFHPTLATQYGVHRYDNDLEDYSKPNIEKQIALLKRFEKRVSAVNATRLSEFVRGDRELILNDIRGSLLELQDIQSWKKDPNLYVRDITASAYTLIERRFASEEDRLKHLIQREKRMPQVLDTAYHNLANPPRIYTEVALQQMPGIIHFFEEEVPRAFSHVSNPLLKEEFAASHASLIRALLRYQDWLQNTLLIQSQGDFRIGKTNFVKKLQYDEMVDTSLEQLLALNESNMRQNQARFALIAKKLYPDKTASQVLAIIKHDYPSPDQLLNAFRNRFGDLRAFIKDKHIMTIPSSVDPIMRETPPFLRAITFASMDVPGPFEKVATESYFNVSLPDPTWSKEKIANFMEEFNYPNINSIAVHEAYPGHYVQFLWVQRLHDPVRRILGAASNSEGWAHYCEQMILDEGLQGKTPYETDMYWLGELLNALMRNARFFVSIKMHTGHMTFDEAVDYFMKEGYVSKEAAIMEAKRGTMDPTYLYYTLGKLQILKLRADLEKQEGEAFRLDQFHNDFMQQGYPPIKIVRRALLHNDSSAL